MIQSLYLGRVAYEDGLRLQTEIAALVAGGRLQNVLLLLEHPPVLTLGRNARRANVLASGELLAARGVTVHEINRGGDVTYHGPGQLVGYPIFNLRDLKNSGRRMGPVDFVRGMEEALIGLCGQYGVAAGRIAGLTGVWCGAGTGASASSANFSGSARKIAAIGIHVARGITSHGFALNVTTNLRDFDLIVPCGIADHAVTSLQREISPSTATPGLEIVANQAAKHFSRVFCQSLETIDSLQQLRQAAADSAPQFPAEDTPLRIPEELQRLHGETRKPVQA